MRTVFSGKVNCQQILSELREALPNNSEIKLVDSSKKNIIILATKEIHCLGDLLIKHVEGKLDANITAVISNYDNLRGLLISLIYLLSIFLMKELIEKNMRVEFVMSSKLISMMSLY